MKKKEFMITKDSIEAAYCFIHQKYRVFAFSDNPIQKDQIECAITQYVEQMNPDLYAKLSEGKKDFLLTHASFKKDMEKAENLLESML
jgi:hypothetical protein